MTRDEILARYRHLQQISKELHVGVLDSLARSAVMEWAKRIGLLKNKQLMLANETEFVLAQDLAIYMPRIGRSHPLDRYAKLSKFPPDSDQALVFNAMQHTRFSLFRRKGRHETAGVLLEDLLLGDTIHVMDEAMERQADSTTPVAVRLLQLPDFAMVAYIMVPITVDLVEEMQANFPRKGPNADRLAHDPGLALRLYRAAVATGAMDHIRFE